MRNLEEQLLKDYTLEEILEHNDLTPEETLEILISAGLINLNLYLYEYHYESDLEEDER